MGARERKPLRALAPLVVRGSRGRVHVRLVGRAAALAKVVPVVSTHSYRCAISFSDYVTTGAFQVAEYRFYETRVVEDTVTQ